MTRKAKKVAPRRRKPAPTVLTTIWDTEDCKVAVKRPAAVEYQWMAHSVMGAPISSWASEKIKNGGWKAVPLKRHLADVPAPFQGARGLIEFSGLVLYEKPAADVAAARAAVWEDAKKMVSDLGYDLKSVGPHSSFTMLAPGMIVSESYDTVRSDAPPVDVWVNIRVRVSARFQDAAAALKLPVDVYAQRRIQLLASGEIAGLLLPVDDPSGDRWTPFEIREIHLNERNG